MDARLHVSRLSGQATVPPSKSAAHRAVLCAALADVVSSITNIEYSQDIRATLGAVTQLGAKVAEEPAAVTITGPDKSRISKVTGYDAAAFSFVCDVDFEEYTVRVVPATSSLHTAGTQIPATGGSTNVSGTAGGYKKNTAINVTIKGADLETASSGDGVKIVKVFVKNAAGTWSAA